MGKIPLSCISLNLQAIMYNMKVRLFTCRIKKQILPQDLTKFTAYAQLINTHISIQFTLHSQILSIVQES